MELKLSPVEASAIIAALPLMAYRLEDFPDDPVEQNIESSRVAIGKLLNRSKDFDHEDIRVCHAAVVLANAILRYGWSCDLKPELRQEISKYDLLYPRLERLLQDALHRP